MTFSKSASLCDTDAPALTQDVKSVRQTASSWRRVFELAFLSAAALHCALYFVWVAQLQTIFPGQKCASRRGGVSCFVCILGDPLLPGGDLPSIHQCLLCTSCQNTPWRNTWDALHAGAAWVQTLTFCSYSFLGHEVRAAEYERPADFFSAVAKLAAVQVQLQRSDDDRR